MKQYLCSLALVLFCGLTSWAQSPVVTFEAEDVIADASGTVSTITVLGSVDSGSVNMEGHSLAFGWDPAMLSVVSLTDVFPFTPSFVSTYVYQFDTTDQVTGDVYPGGTAGHAALYSFGFSNVVPLDQAPVPLLQFTVFADPGVQPGATTDIGLIDTFDSPGTFTWFNSFVYDPPGGGAAVDNLIPLPLPFTTLSFIDPDPSFLRGDMNGDGAHSISDAIFLLEWGYGGGASPGCFAAVDIYGDGLGSPIEETLRFLEFFFLGGPIASLGCGQNDPGTLTCDTETSCP